MNLMDNRDESEKNIKMAVDAGNPHAFVLYTLTMKLPNKHEMVVKMCVMLLEAAKENDAY